jgi:hypothetical protein
MTASGRQPSSLTLAHKALWDAQCQNGDTLPMDLAADKLQTTSGIIFSPGTTFMDVYHKLEKYDLVEIDGEARKLRVLEW